MQDRCDIYISLGVDKFIFLIASYIVFPSALKILVLALSFVLLEKSKETFFI